MRFAFHSYYFISLVNRGYWWERLALNYDQHLKNPEKALAAIQASLKDPDVRVGHKLALALRVKKILSSRSTKKQKSNILKIYEESLKPLIDDLEIKEPPVVSECIPFIYRKPLYTNSLIIKYEHHLSDVLCWFVTFVITFSRSESMAVVAVAQCSLLSFLTNNYSNTFCNWQCLREEEESPCKCQSEA